MTGLTILKQAYSMLEDAVHLARADSDEQGMVAVNQIYSELWYREHRSEYRPLKNLREKIQLSWRYLPAMAYGTAMLLTLNATDDRDYTRYQKLYERAANHTGGMPDKRRDVLFHSHAM